MANKVDHYCHLVTTTLHWSWLAQPGHPSVAGVISVCDEGKKPEMSRPRGQTGVEDKIVASKVRLPYRPQAFGFV